MIYHNWDISNVTLMNSMFDGNQLSDENQCNIHTSNFLQMMPGHMIGHLPVQSMGVQMQLPVTIMI